MAGAESEERAGAGEAEQKQEQGQEIIYFTIYSIQLFYAALPSLREQWCECTVREGASTALNCTAQR